jgi:sarcosine oxidase subunit gamma
VVELIEKSAGAGLLPITQGALTLSEVVQRQITSIAPQRGKEKVVATALKKATGLTLPDVGKSDGKDGAQIIWTARGQYFLIGADAPNLSAALTDQSDAWCAVMLDGVEAADVMARLCPIDVSAMQQGDVARSLIGHMSAIIIREADGFQIMVFRAFAKTLIHEMHRAMRTVAAKSTIA